MPEQNRAVHILNNVDELIRRGMSFDLNQGDRLDQEVRSVDGSCKGKKDNKV